VRRTQGHATGGAAHADHSGGTSVGKRYVTALGALEVLCTKGGAGSLSVNGEQLGTKAPKPLPASD
jgi:hypothetical protein